MTKKEIWEKYKKIVSGAEYDDETILKKECSICKKEFYPNDEYIFLTNKYFLNGEYEYILDPEEIDCYCEKCFMKGDK